MSDMSAVVGAVPKKNWNRTEILIQSFGINLFGLALPIFILQVYDRVLPLGAKNSLVVLVIGLFVVLLLDLGLKFARARVISWNGAQFDHLARMTAVKKILHCPLERFESESPAAYLDKINSISAVKEFYSTQIATLIIDLPFAFLYLGVFYLLGSDLVFVPIVLLVVFWLMATGVGFRLRKAVTNRMHDDDKRYDFLIEALKGIHTVKAMNLKPVLLKKFERLQSNAATSVRQVAKESASAQVLGTLFSKLNMVCVIGFGAVMVVKGELSAGQLAACMLLSGRALQPLQSAMGIWTNFQTVKVAAKQAADVMTLPREQPEGLPKLSNISGSLELRDVNFAYGGGAEPFIKNVNLKIEPGEVVSIEGANSSGRTTLFLLILGLLRPQSGQILLDGKEIFEHDLQSVRGEISMISNNAPLYSGNLIENMTGYQLGDIIYRALDLAEALGLEEEIKNLPEGYDTQVGGSTVERIAGGIRQRIAIVRALVDDPKLILFDEGNLALDSQSSGLLLDLFKKMKGDATIILVTNTPSFYELSDRHFTMEEGVLAEKVEG